MYGDAKMYGCTRIKRKMENEKESEREEKRQTEKKRRDALQQASIT